MVDSEVEVARVLLAQATASASARDLGTLSDVEAARARLLVPLLLVVAAALGLSGLVPLWPAGARAAVPRPAATIVGESDGLPAVLVVGQHYSARFEVGFPADWPPERRADRPDTHGDLLLYFRRDGTMDDLIASSSRQEDVVGKVVVWECDLSFSDKYVGGITVFLIAGAGLFPNAGATIKAFRHTVASAPAR